MISDKIISKIKVLESNITNTNTQIYALRKELSTVIIDELLEEGLPDCKWTFYFNGQYAFLTPRYHTKSFNTWNEKLMTLCSETGIDQFDCQDHGFELCCNAHYNMFKIVKPKTFARLCIKLGVELDTNTKNIFNHWYHYNKKNDKDPDDYRVKTMMQMYSSAYRIIADLNEHKRDESSREVKV